MKTSKDIIIEHFHCEYDQDGNPLCNEPCDSTEVCSYCGNRFVSCEQTVETEDGDGPMHPDCAMRCQLESKAIVNLTIGRQHGCSF